MNWNILPLRKSSDVCNIILFNNVELFKVTEYVHGLEAEIKIANQAFINVSTENQETTRNY